MVENISKSEIKREAVRIMKEGGPYKIVALYNRINNGLPMGRRCEIAKLNRVLSNRDEFVQDDSDRWHLTDEA